MKTFLLAALAAVSAAMMPAAAQVAPTVYGNLIYTGSWGDEDATNAGVYSFAASADGPMELVYKPADNNVYANGGAVYADGRYYVLTRVPNSGKAQKNTLYVYDTDTWALVERRDAPLTLSASDLTWCPVDGKIYGVFLNATASGYDFGTLSLADLSVDVIKPLDLADKIGPMPMLGLAADTEGDVYGVGSDGNLYRFDRASGDYTLVGPTGFTPSRWNMSACFDFTTKEMYWAGCNLDRSALFRIDTATGEATAVREFADDEEFVGLYTLSSVADLDGPQAPEAFTVALDGPSTSARISFTLPSTAINGTALDGPLDYTVTSNGTLLFQGSGAPGEAISRDIALAEGLHAIEARCATAAGSRGASVRRTVYAGIDTPAAPASASAEKTGDAVAITWVPVTSGANNGYIDPATLTYTVTRMPDAATVASGITANTCTDTSLPAALADYTYEVRATASGKTGNPAVTPKLTLGYAVTPPVAYDLTDEEQFKFFTVDDANADGSTWKWSANGADAATALTSCEYTDTDLDASVQTALQYTVYASNVAGESTGCNSNMLIFGSAYPVPFAESFAGGKASTAPWTTVRGSDSGYPEWSASTKSIYDTADSSQDADLGWMKYSSKGTITLQSPVVDIASAANPALKFWYRTADSSGDAVALDVLISPDRGVTFESVASITATSPEWTLRTVDLAAFRGCASLQVAFKASTQQYQDLLLDNIRITDVCAADLALTAFTGAADPVAGTEAVYTVRVANNGLAAASGYEVTIAASGIELASVQGEEIAPDATASIDIPVTIPVNLADATLTATIDFDADQNTADNAATLDIAVRAPRLPAIDGLAAACEDGAVRLTWPRAAADRAPSAMTDDLETLTAWDFGGVNATNAHGTIGDYKIYDADGQATVVASSWLTQPNGGQPMAFQVNRNGASYPEVDLKSYNINSFSGTTSLIAWGSAEGASSDWLILPELYPGETVISFRAHATPMGWGASPAEKLDVLYSATTDAIDAFTPFVTAVEVPAGTEYDADKGFALFSYTLPADARYAAVRVSLSTTQNKAVVIDDITFTPASAPREALEIEGYNIYRDGVLIAATADETYLDADAAEGTHTYNVTTRYTIGESLFSNPADAAVTGLPVGSTANDTTVEYYTIQGIRLPGAPTAPGIYIRRTGSKAEKVRY